MAEAADNAVLEKAKRALVDELRRQALRSGNTFETDGRLAQVDGSFELEPLVRAVLKAGR